MSALLLSLHVLAAIVAFGPICVAASMFPAEARRALDRRAAAREAGTPRPGCASSPGSAGCTPRSGSPSPCWA